MTVWERDQFGTSGPRVTSTICVSGMWHKGLNIGHTIATGLSSTEFVCGSIPFSNWLLFCSILSQVKALVTQYHLWGSCRYSHDEGQVLDCVFGRVFQVSVSIATYSLVSASHVKLCSSSVSMEVLILTVWLQFGWLSQGTKHWWS